MCSGEGEAAVPLTGLGGVVVVVVVGGGRVLLYMVPCRCPLDRGARCDPHQHRTDGPRRVRFQPQYSRLVWVRRGTVSRKQPQRSATPRDESASALTPSSYVSLLAAGEFLFFRVFASWLRLGPTRHGDPAAGGSRPRCAVDMP